MRQHLVFKSDPTNALHQLASLKAQELMPDLPQPSIDRSKKYKLNLSLLGLILSLAVGIVGVFQTRFFVSVLPRPDTAVVREHIRRCRNFQNRTAADIKNPSGGIVFKLFDVEPTRKLEKAKESLVNDSALQAELINKFGVCFRDLDVIVAPAWVLPNDNEQLGITPEGWKQAKLAKGESDVGGLTLRNQPSQKPVTIDGRPRIVLNPNAFQSAETLRLVLFHELLHALNVPGVYPWPLTFAQNDLTYLPEYRAFIWREGLEGWDESRTWVLAVVVPWLIGFRLARRVRYYVSLGN